MSLHVICELFCVFLLYTSTDAVIVSAIKATYLIVAEFGSVCQCYFVVDYCKEWGN